MEPQIVYSRRGSLIRRSENEVSLSKRDPDAPTGTSGRDRRYEDTFLLAHFVSHIVCLCRFRRDADDNGETIIIPFDKLILNKTIADVAPRPTFRSALSQPSQMGNFKHQSLRSTDRDADRERDRDGAERLRNVS